MNVLYLDASRDRLSVGLDSAGSWRVLERIEGRHDEMLLESVETLCESANLRLQELDRCVVVNGPGSFTGLRITVSAVHALDAVHPLRVLPIDQLSLLASMHADAAEAVIDAKMGEAYYGRELGGTGLFTAIDVIPLDRLPTAGLRVCHAHECDLFANVTGVTPGLDNLRELAHRQPESAWIAGGQLTPRYVRNTVSWKPLSEQPSKLYDR